MKLRCYIIIVMLALLPAVGMAAKQQGYFRSLSATLEELPNVSGVLKEPVALEGGRIARSGHTAVGTVSLLFQFTGETMERLDGVTVLMFVSGQSTDADIGRASALTELVIRGLFHNTRKADYVMAWIGSSLSRQMDIVIAGGKPKDAEKLMFDDLVKASTSRHTINGNAVIKMSVTTHIE